MPRRKRVISSSSETESPDETIRRRPTRSQKPPKRKVAKGPETIDHFGSSGDDGTPMISQKGCQSKVPRFRIPSSQTYFRSSGASVPESLLWTDKHAPQTVDELAVHKKKVGDTKTWLSNALASKKPAILVLTGPAGIGKTALIQALARDLSCEVCEWLAPVVSNNDNDAEQGLFTESVSVQFRSFILKSAAMSPLSIIEGAETKPTTSPSSKRIILVDDLPNTAHPVLRTSIHQTLLDYMTSLRQVCPLVLIITTIPLHSFSSHASDVVTLRSFLPVTLIPRITEMALNPIAPTFMTKALNRILDRESTRFKTNRKAVIDKIVQEADGDLRWAVNTLQFLYLKMDMKDGQNGLDSLCKDHHMVLFSALGKILYNKRKPAPSSGDFEEDARSLPDFLAHHRRDRVPEHVTETVVDSTPVDPTTFVQYLHQNYLDFFGEVDDVVAASAYLSDADAMLGQWDQVEVMKGYAALVSARGLLFTNQHPTSMSYRQQYKPDVWRVLTEARERDMMLKETCWKHWMKRHEQWMNWVETKSKPIVSLSRCNRDELIFDVVPHLKQMMQHRSSFIEFTSQDRMVINKLSWFDKNGFRSLRHAVDQKQGDDVVETDIEPTQKESVHESLNAVEVAYGNLALEEISDFSDE